MSSLRYSQLSNPAKSAVLNRYGVYQKITPCAWCDSHPLPPIGLGTSLYAYFKNIEEHACTYRGMQTSSMGWKFTEHGERIT